MFAANLGIYDQIITVDAHHDMWGSDGIMGSNLFEMLVSKEQPKGTIACHNWLRKYLSRQSDTLAYFVQTDWGKEIFKRPEPNDPIYTDLWDRVEERWPEEADITCIHICRSGCWTPPWLDEQFLTFVHDPALPTVSLQEDEWDPMISRWTEEMEAGIKWTAEVGKLVMEGDNKRHEMD